MIPKIKRVLPIDEFKLFVAFDDGKKVIYDVWEDIRDIDEFKALKDTYGLWNHVQLEQSRTCIFWNDRIDLASDNVYEYGKEICSDEEPVL